MDPSPTGPVPVVQRKLPGLTSAYFLVSVFSPLSNHGLPLVGASAGGVGLGGVQKGPFEEPLRAHSQIL